MVVDSKISNPMKRFWIKHAIPSMRNQIKVWKSMAYQAKRREEFNSKRQIHHKF
jgi:hypothetical protein